MDVTAARALHDRLEEAYFVQMSQGGGRWFERRRTGYLLAGFAGLDSPTMSRLAVQDLTERGLEEAIEEATAFFDERNLPWCVHLTPLSRPEDAVRLLRSKGFYLASELTVMTREREAPVRTAPSVRVREMDPREAGAFTALAVDAFRMPTRYLAPLTDITRGWIDSGARAYVAEVEGRPAGTAMLAEAKGVHAIYNVGTLRAFRRRGVAHTLMARAFEDAKAESAKTVTLQVATGSEAEAMYQKLGFESRYRWQLFARL